MIRDEKLVYEILRELRAARAQHGPMHGPHEAWAVIYEEVDELWDLVRLKKDQQQHMAIKSAMKRECIQIAAMAMRAILDLEWDGGEERGEKT